MIEKKNKESSPTQDYVSWVGCMTRSDYLYLQ
nr:MAG TPA: hypothetical protein [Caudoviricetes sp.]